jgi:hypothetical protein
VGRPGGSAQARWRRTRAAEWVAWIRTLPWRAAVTLGIGAGADSSAASSRPGWDWWPPGSRPSQLGGGYGSGQPRRRRLAARGAGERRTARLLDPLKRHGWAVLHDLAVAGSRANLDHLVIGPGGCS